MRFAPVREPRKVRGGTEERRMNMALELGGRQVGRPRVRP